MNLGDCTVTIGNKKVLVTNVEVSYESCGFDQDRAEVSIQGRIMGGEIEAEVDKDKIDSLTYAFGGRNWGKTARAYEHLFSLKPNDFVINLEQNSRGDWLSINNSEEEKVSNLTKEYVNEQLDEETKILREEGIVGLDGTLTPEGEQFLLNVVFQESEFRDLVVDAVKSLRKAKEEKKGKK